MIIITTKRAKKKQHEQRMIKHYPGLYRIITNRYDAM